MADAADITQLRTEQEEELLRRQIAAKASADHALRPKQSCYNCFEPLPDKHLFCDQFCEMDYAARERERRQRLVRT